MNDNDIVITVVIKPLKGKSRKVLVTGAPVGEMLAQLTGTFEERHSLIDQMYADLLKRKPQVVTKPKPKNGGRSTPQTTKPDEPEATAEAEPAATEESGEEVVITTLPDNLPVIEGDTDEQMTLLPDSAEESNGD